MDGAGFVLMRWWCSRLAVLCLLVAAPASGAAQDVQTDRLRVWLEAGPMFGAASGPDVNTGGALHLRVQRSRHRFGLRMLALGDATSSSSDALGELALLYGRGVGSRTAFLAISAGPGLVAADGCGDASAISCDGFGLSVVAEAGVHTRLLGIGLQAFGSVNSVAAYGGLGLTLLLGWMP